MENEDTEFISIDQRGRLIKVLENLEDKIAKQNSLKRTFLKGIVYGLGTLVGATIIVAIFGGLIATTINMVVGEDVLSEKLAPPNS